MKCLPEFSEVQRIAAIGQYDVLPVSCEMLSDFTTPIETMKILRTSPPTATCWSPLWPTRSGGGTPSWGLIPSWR